MERRTSLFFGALLLPALIAIGLWLLDGSDHRVRPEAVLVPIPLTGGPERPEAEISSLAWYGDRLVMLPQYPGRFGSEGIGGAVFTLRRAEVEAFLDGRVAGPLRAERVPLDAPRLFSSLPGFDGFEALVFRGQRLYVTVECRPDAAETVGFLMSGHVVGDLERLVVDVSHRVRLRAQNRLRNTGYETLVASGDRLLAIYETNGTAVNRAPRALTFDPELRAEGELPIAPLEYRVTDASDVDAQGRFWVTNYHWPGAAWAPARCPLTRQYGTGPTHAQCRAVERLVELRITADRIVLGRRAPILFQLTGGKGRNWEGLVRLPGRGFLVMTDEYPASILAFVPAPGT